LAGQIHPKVNELKPNTLAELGKKMGKLPYFNYVQKSTTFVACHCPFKNPVNPQDDFTIAVLLKNVEFKNAVDGQVFTAVAEPKEGDEVFKSGPVTQRTAGKIIKRQEDVFIIQPVKDRFSQKGDSGSAVYNKSGEIVGIMLGFGSARTLNLMEEADGITTAALPIQYIFQKLNASFGCEVTLAPAEGRV